MCTKLEGHKSGPPGQRGCYAAGKTHRGLGVAIGEDHRARDRNFQNAYTAVACPVPQEYINTAPTPNASSSPPIPCSKPPVPSALSTALPPSLPVPCPSPQPLAQAFTTEALQKEVKAVHRSPRWNPKMLSEVQQSVNPSATCAHLVGKGTA